MNESPNYDGDQIPVSWYAVDTPATSVFVPFLPEVEEYDHSYRKGVNTKFTRDSAWWAFDFVNNQMRVNYNAMSENDVYPLRKSLQDFLDKDLVEHAYKHNGDRQALGKWQKNVLRT